MSLDNYRKQINELDEKIVQLLNERIEVTAKIGQAKLKKGQAIFVPNREKEVYKRVSELNKGPLSNDAIQAIYREVMSAALSMEKPLKISYFGTEGTFTHQATRKKFGSQLEYMSCASIAQVFENVESDKCEYGVVPIENSIEGAVTHTFDLLVDTELKICSEIRTKIQHHLLSKCEFKDVKTVYSHPQALGQCRQWLQKNLPHAELVSESSTTAAAKKAKRSKTGAAIASKLAADIYDLNILKTNIQDIAHNTTRFLVLSKQDVPATGEDRTSLLFSIKDRVGALFAVLEPFQKRKINLTKIESRPSKKKAWSYYFFVDISGHVEDKIVKDALSDYDVMDIDVKVLGSYPVVQ